MKNKVYYCTQKGVFEKNIVELPIQLDSNYVFVKYLFCGICGGDYSTYIGRRKSYPYSLGHEFVAKIIRVGENVNSLSLGQYVISDFNYRCGVCDYCHSNKSHLCDKNDIHFFSNRAFAEYGMIHQNYLYKINMSTHLARACFMEPLSCVIHAIEITSPNSHLPILINGVGSIGTMMVFYLSTILHWTNIYINDINKSRLNNIMRCFNVKLYEPIVKPDIIYECTNSIAGVRDALHIASLGTSICVMSHLYGENTSFIYEECCRKELTAYFPLRNGERENIYRSIDCIEKYWVPQMDTLYYISDDIEEIFHQKPYVPYNKQILNISKVFKNEDA